MVHNVLHLEEAVIERLLAEQLIAVGEYAVLILGNATVEGIILLSIYNYVGSSNNVRIIQVAPKKQ